MQFNRTAWIRDDVHPYWYAVWFYQGGDAGVGEWWLATTWGFMGWYHVQSGWVLQEDSDFGSWPQDDSAPRSDTVAWLGGLEADPHDESRVSRVDVGVQVYSGDVSRVDVAVQTSLSSGGQTGLYLGLLTTFYPYVSGETRTRNTVVGMD